MNTARYPLSFPPDEASAWRRIRRYAVPKWMIEQAMERREAGDWRGACAAANVDVQLDLADIAARHGIAIRAQVEQDLAHFAPDLLRWHLPRYLNGRTTLSPRRSVLLAGYGGQPVAGPYLVITTPPMIDGPQRLTLRFGNVIEDEDETNAGEDDYYSRSRSSRISKWRRRTQNWITSRQLWDARKAGELRGRSGTERHAGWITRLHDQGEIKQALAVAGVTMDDKSWEQLGSRASHGPSFADIVARLPLDLTRLEPEIRRLVAAGFSAMYQIELPSRWARWFRLLVQAHPVTGVTLSMASSWHCQDLPTLPEACWRRLPDLDLLDFGDITPARLHPLVSASLFPERIPQATDGPPELFRSASARVRCRGEWHEIRSGNSGLRTPHSLEEEQRERAMHVFGGPVAGCFSVQHAWAAGTGRLPNVLRDEQREIFSRVQHGDTPGVLQLLDAGIDPHVRNGRRQTLLHLLHLLDYGIMLPRLLAAGLDIEARDHHQQTPLYVAVNQGPAGLVKALLEAGARTDVADRRPYGHSRNLADIIVWHEREDLPFLADVVRRDYPDLGSPRCTRSRPYG